MNERPLGPLGLARYLLWPFRGLEALGVSGRSHAAPAVWRSPSLLRFMLSTQPGRYAALVGVDVVGALADLALPVALGRALVLGPSTAAAADLQLVGALILLRSLLQLPARYLELRAHEHNCDFIRASLLAAPPDPGRAARVRTALGRDLPRLLEGLRAVVEIGAGAAAIALTAALVLAATHLAAMAAAASLVFFLPWSIVLSRTRAALARRIFQAASRRFDAASRWVDHAPAARRLGLPGAGADVVGGAAEQETSLRARDSLLRGADLYSMAFGKVLPTALVLLAAARGGAAGADATTGLWLSTLLIAHVLRVSRARVTAAEGHAAFASLGEMLARRSEPALDDGAITLDETWEIFPGTLADNAPGTEGLRALERLGVTGELAARGEPGSLLLAVSGRDVSAGQRTRILLARAIGACITEGKPRLVIDVPLSSLDGGAAQRLRALVGEVRERAGLEVIITPAREAELARLADPSADAGHHHPPEPRRSGVAPAKGTASPQGGGAPAKVGALRQLIRPQHAMIAMPAALLSLAGLVATEPTDTPIKAAQLAALGVAGACLGVLAGTRVEQHVRAWALGRFRVAALLQGNASSADAFQRLGQDFTAVGQRIAWYVHDVAWLLALFVTTLASVTIALSGAGALASAIIVACYLALARGLLPAVVAARRSSAARMNLALEAAEAAAAVGTGRALGVLRSVEAGFTQGAMSHYLRQLAETEVTKGYALSLAQLLSGVFLFAVCAVAEGSPADTGVRAVAGTALINMDLRAAVLFAALAGLMAQRAAVDRLAEPDVPAPSAPRATIVRRASDAIRVEAFIHPEDGELAYPAQSFPPSAPVQVTGASGRGKSRYLRAVADASPGESAYIDTGAVSFMQWLAEHGVHTDSDALEAGADPAGIVRTIARRALRRGACLLILDEPFASLTRAEALSAVDTIVEEARAYQAAVLVVDHRLALPVAVDIEGLLPQRRARPCAS